MQTLGADFSTFQGFKSKNKSKESFSNNENEENAYYDGEEIHKKEESDPVWLVIKNYDYLSFDHKNGMSQWSIFYSEFSH